METYSSVSFQSDGGRERHGLRDPIGVQSQLIRERVSLPYQYGKRFWSRGRAYWSEWRRSSTMTLECSAEDKRLHAVMRKERPTVLPLIAHTCMITCFPQLNKHESVANMSDAEVRYCKTGSTKSDASFARPWCAQAWLTAFHAVHSP
jgi:hypothetical protein